MDPTRDLDRLSALPDELLHLILTFMRADATTIIGTAVLSRRWRRVWIYAQRLNLSYTKVRHGRFVGYVDWVLAQRGNADIESLNISMPLPTLVADTSPVPPEKINEWLRYAMQRVVKSFCLEQLHSREFELPLLVHEPAVVLPDNGGMTSITLFLISYRFQLPVAASARYEALTELTLFGPSFGGEEFTAGGHTLGDFVSSSCCPRLRKLEIYDIEGLPQLALRSETLEEFKLWSPTDLQSVDVTAPNLRVLDLRLQNLHCDGSVEHVRIAPARLQEVSIQHLPDGMRPDLEIHGLTSVRRLSHLRLNMHGQYYVRTTDVGFWLLEKCPSVEHVDVQLEHHPSPSSVIEEDDIAVDLTMEDAAPFASVRSMDITVNTGAQQFPDGQLVPSIFALLRRCPCVRSLHLWIFHDTASYMSYWASSCFCASQYPWTDQQAVSLESLEEVTISGFMGADEDMDLVSLLFASSKNSIKSMTLDKITKAPGTVSLKRMMMAEEDDVMETVDQLMNIPTVDRGRWHFGDTIYTWTRFATEKYNTGS